jgi:hypothetical protein
LRPTLKYEEIAKASPRRPKVQARWPQVPSTKTRVRRRSGPTWGTRTQGRDRMCAHKFRSKRVDYAAPARPCCAATGEAEAWQREEDHILIAPKPGTQQREVLDHLLQLGTISAVEANALYRVTSLTKVISVLKDNGNGWCIRAEWKRDQTGRRYARYYLDCEECHQRAWEGTPPNRATGVHKGRS